MNKMIINFEINRPDYF